MSLVQVPFRQAWPAEQAFPQSPQCAMLLWMSTQPPPQQAWPGPHAGPAPQRHSPPSQVSPTPQAGSQGGSTHWPLSQTCPVGQTLPQAPQSVASVRGSTQRPLQQTFPSAQGSPEPQRHSPDAQTLPKGVHGLLHAPQSTSELSRLTHAPSQQVRPLAQLWSGPHAGRQVPARQMVPFGQAGSQSPVPLASGAVVASIPASCGPGSVGLPCAHPRANKEAKIKKGERRMDLTGEMKGGRS